MNKFLMGIGAFVAGCTLMATPSANELINSAGGAKPPKFDANGLIVSVMVVGKAAPNEALRDFPGEAAEMCGDEARDNARAELVKFLSTQVEYGKDTAGNTAMTSAGGVATDENGKQVKVSASAFKKERTTKEQLAQRAKSCVSGLVFIAEGMDQQGRYTSVGVWDTRALKSLEGLAKQQNEINAEVSDMGQAAKEKKAVKDAIERENLKAKSQQGNNAGSTNSNSAKPAKRDGDLYAPSSIPSGANDYF